MGPRPRSFVFDVLRGPSRIAWACASFRKRVTSARKPTCAEVRNGILRSGKSSRCSPLVERSLLAAPPPVRGDCCGETIVKDDDDCCDCTIGPPGVQHKHS